MEKKFRIAVCLSGQARHWRLSGSNIKAFFNYNRTHSVLNCPIETDYFIHTWDTNTWRYPKMGHTNFYEERHNDRDEIEKMFLPKKIEQQEWSQDLFPTHNAWMPMFYSFEKSLMLKREYELANDFEYDAVVKARLDIIYKPNHQIPFWTIKPGVNGLVPGVCYASKPIFKFTYEFNYNNFDDVLFYGDSRTMDLVGDLYRSYQQRYTPEDFKDIQTGINVNPSLYYGPGCLLYDHMVRMGIHPQSFSEIIDYVVVRSTAIGNGWDGILDFEKIKQKYIEWYSKPWESVKLI